MKTRHVGALLASVFAVAQLGCEGSRLEGTSSAPPADVLVDSTDTMPPDDTTPDDAADTGETADDVADVGDTGPDVVAPDPEWEAVALGDLGRIGGVAVVSATEAYAASGPRVLRFNGATWAAYGEPDPARDVNGVWSDGAVIIAVGADGLVARRPAMGGAWTLDTTEETADLYAVAGRSAEDLVVVGDDGTVLRSTESGWEKRHSRTSLRLRGVWIDPEATGDEGVYAVGSNGQLVEEVGGVLRGTQIAASAAVLSGFTRLEDGTLIAVGSEHTLTAKRPNSPAWQGETTNDARQRAVRAVIVGDDGVVRAFGDEGLVLKREGLVWSVDTSPGAIVGVRNFVAAGTFGTGAAAGMLALGAEGGGIVFRSGSWSAQSTALDGTVTDLAEGPTGRLFATATRGIAMTRDDAGWSVIPLPFDTDLLSVAPDGAGGAFYAGAAGRLLHVDADGHAEVISVAVPVDLFGVATDGTRTFVCGRGGTLFAVTRDGDDWTITARSTATVADLRDVHVDADGDVWVVGAFGTLLRGDAEAGGFEAIPTGTGGGLNALAEGPAGLFAVGDNGVIFRIDGGAVSLESELPGVFLQGVSVRGQEAIAAGSGGTILRRVAGATPSWEREVPATAAATFDSALIDSTGQAWLGSNRREASLERRLELLDVGGTP